MYFRLPSILILLFISPALFAANLCDNACSLEITFPSGGSFVADEPASFSFGNSGELLLGATGTVNKAVQPATTDFSTGGTLTLAADESIYFDKGGRIYLGENGNLDYSAITVTSSGTISIQALGGKETVDIYTFNGSGVKELNISSKNLVIHSSLNFNDATINLDTGNTTIFLESPDIITISSPETGTVDSTTSSLILTSENFSNFSSLNTSSATLINNGNILTNSMSSAITISTTSVNQSLIIEPATFSVESLLLNSPDTEPCQPIINDSAILCKTSDGTSYEYINGEWVAIDEAGTTHPSTGFVIGILLFYLRKKQPQDNRKRAG